MCVKGGERERKRKRERERKRKRKREREKERERERERETYLGRLENTPGSISSDSFSRRFLDGEGKNSETEEDDEVREERGEDDIFKIGKEQLRRMRQASKQQPNPTI